MSELGEKPDRQQVNIRLDPSLHMIMKGAKDILEASSMDDVYTMAVEEFIANHPEIVDGVEASITESQAIALGALERLSELRDD